MVFTTTLVYKLVLFSPGLCRGKGGTNAHVKKKSLGVLLILKDMKHQGRGTKETKGLKGYGNVVGRKPACGVELHYSGQNHTTSHNNNTTFSSERATFYLKSLVLSF